MNDRQVIDAERDQVLQRFFALPRRDQLEVYGVVREFLAVGVAPPTTKDKRVAQQRAAVQAIDAAAKHLRLESGKAPTSVEFDKVAHVVAPEWSSGRVIRVFGRWREAVRVYERGPSRLYAKQLEIETESSGRRRSYEGYWTGVRLWLKSNPAAKSRASYTAFVEDYNDDLKPGERPLPGDDAIVLGLNLDWADIVRVTEGEIDLKDAAPRKRRKLPELPDAEGAFGLIGAKRAAEICGVTGKCGHGRLICQPGFPPVAISVPNLRLWRRVDVESYAAGERDFSHRQANELRPLLMTVPEIAEAVGVQRHDVRGLPGLPAPVAVCGRRRLFLRDDVEAAREELRAVVAERRKYGPQALGSPQAGPGLRGAAGRLA